MPRGRRPPRKPRQAKCSLDRGHTRRILWPAVPFLCLTRGPHVGVDSELLKLHGFGLFIFVLDLLVFCFLSLASDLLGFFFDDGLAPAACEGVLV